MQRHAERSGSVTKGYRPDIDGLRALAVLLVVAYHAWPALVPGGYIGVDVFFVISGYLITRLIIDDIARGQFSVADFYVRRSKRIFPALFAVVSATVILALPLLTPSALAQLGSTVAATAGFFSNVAFWREAGYFDTAAELKPLLHTWSLAVEEQFYVFWPLTLLLLRGRASAKKIILVSIVSSLVLSIYLTGRHQASAFYLLPPRAWELLLGASLSLRYIRVPDAQWVRDSFALAGVSLIGGAAALLDRDSAFPGLNAVFPCVGAMLIIAAGDSKTNKASDWLLARQPVVFIGLISYSLYLWHWPLLVLARIVHRGHLTTQTGIFVVAVAFVAATITWRYIETPFRRRGTNVSASLVLVRYALLLAVLLFVGVGMYASGGLRALASDAVLSAELARYNVNPLSEKCLRWQSDSSPLPGERCITGNSKMSPRLVIWGDSHADALAPGLVGVALSRDYATYQLTMAGCPPLISVEPRGIGADYRPCTEFNRQVIRYIESEPQVKVVVLSARWTLYTENRRYGDDPGPITYLVDDQDVELNAASSKRVFTRGMIATISAIQEMGRQVIVLGTIPPIGVNVPECLARNYLPFSGREACDGDAAQVRHHLEFADAEILRVAGLNRNVCAYFPKQALCPADRCQTVAEGQILYANDDHLTLSGAAFVAKALPVDACLSKVSEESLAGQWPAAGEP